MKITNGTYIRKLLAAVALFGIMGSAMAIPLSGAIEYGTTMSPLDVQDGNIVTLGNADYLDFDPNTTTVDAAEGAFLSFVGSNLQLEDFYIDPFTADQLVWTIPDMFTFTLTSLTIVEQNDHTLELSGLGYFSDLNGFYEDTIGEWSLTAQDAGNPSPILTFSASTASVPEPNALMLLGLSLVMFGFVNSRKKKA